MLPIERHIEKALQITDAEVENLRILARQLQGQTVLPILGAGASYDCGMRVASKIAADLHADCITDQALKPAIEKLPQTDLGQIAEAIFASRGDNQQAVLEAVGLPNSSLWPGTPDIDPHFCVLRILARAVREHEGWKKALSFNYDCCSEAALKSEGFRFSRETGLGPLWLDHADIICSKRRYEDLSIRDGFELVKAHGCAEHYRTEYAEDPSSDVAESIIIRAAQINSWSGRDWARDALRDRVRTGILVLIGFSGQDPATVEELKDVLEDIHRERSQASRPRLVVIDHDPHTEALQQLVDFGVGPDGANGSAVTEICTASTSTTAVLQVLLTEMIALELQSSAEGLKFELPVDLDDRLALLAFSGPSMARWSFLLDKNASSEFLQRVNAAMSENLAYVPLRHNPRAIIRAFKIREEIRTAVSVEGPERAEDLCRSDGFIAQGGRAYMPLGLDVKKVTEAHRDGALAQAKDALPWPRDLSPILVCEDDGALRGVSVETGREVAVP